MTPSIPSSPTDQPPAADGAGPGGTGPGGTARPSVDPVSGVGPVLVAVATAVDLTVAASPLPVVTADGWTVAGWTDHPDDVGQPAPWLAEVARAWVADRPAQDALTSSGPHVPCAAVGRHAATGTVRAIVQGGVGPGLTWWRGRGPDGREQLVLATHPAPTVSRVHPRAEIDPDFLLRLLLLREPPGGSAYRDVHRLPPGWELRWQPGQAPQARRWFRLEDVPPMDLRDPGDALAAYRAALDTAIAAHLPVRGDVGASLSGGLDSTAVVAIAARLLAPDGRSVHAWTHAAVPGHEDTGVPGWVGDETHLARLLAARYPGTTVTDVRNTDRVLGIDAALAASRRTWLPTRNPQNQVWIDEIRRQAAARGLSVVLSGASGNASFSADRPAALAELLVRGRVGQVIDLARERARATGRPLSVVLRGQAVWPLLPPGFRTTWNRLRRRGIGAPTADYLQRLPLAAGSIERFGDVAEQSVAMSGAEETRSGWLAWMGLSYGLNAGQSAASFGGVMYADPLGSRLVQTAAAAMPPQLWLAEGRTRALARAVMADEVPDEIRLRTQRGAQAMDWHDAVAGAQDVYLAVVADLAGSETVRAVLDVDRLRRFVTDEWPTEFDPSLTGDWDLPVSRSIAVGRFVRWWETGGD